MAERINTTGVKVFLIALLSLVLGVSQGLTQDWSSVLKEAETKYAKLEKEVQDMTIMQEMKMVTAEGETTLEMKMLRKGNNFRIETKMGMPGTPGIPEGMGTIVVYDGKDTWMISSFMGKRKLSGEEEKQYQRERNWWELVSENAKIVGSEKLDKQECYVVEIEKGGEFPFTKVWLDKGNLILTKGESKGPKLIESKENDTLKEFFNNKGKFEVAGVAQLVEEGFCKP